MKALPWCEGLFKPLVTTLGVASFILPARFEPDMRFSPPVSPTLSNRLVSMSRDRMTALPTAPLAIPLAALSSSSTVPRLEDDNDYNGNDLRDVIRQHNLA